MDKMTKEIKESTNRGSYRDDLQRLCFYYIDCIQNEQKKGIDISVEDKIQYCEVKKWPTAMSELEIDSRDLVRKIMTSNGTIGYLGYPVLLKYA